jgi:type VI secretion system protein ImpA
MIPLDKLLAPVSEAAPSGEDPSMTGKLFELETEIQGKPETQFSPAEPPDWKALKAHVLEVAETTKDLRVGGILTATLVRIEGLKGLGDGIKLLRGYVEKFWPSVFPLLDATENNDPSERINALSNLAAPVGSDGDVLRVIAGLRAAPLLTTPQFGSFTLMHHYAVKGTIPWVESAGAAPTAEMLEAAQKAVGPETVKATVDTAQSAIDDLLAIEKYFKETAGSSLFPSFEPLRRELKVVVSWLGVADAPAPSAEPAAGGAPGEVAKAGGGSGGGGRAITGEVQSREDVLRVIDAIVTYYRRTEPSSPVPFILTRVKRIVNMNFIELISELTPEAMDRILGVTGPVGDSNTPKA